MLGEYSAETVQVVATAMRAGMNVEQFAEMQFAFPTFTEAVSMAPESLPQHRHRAIPARLELPRPPGMSHHDRLPMTGDGTTTPGVTVERVVERVAAKIPVQSALQA